MPKTRFLLASTACALAALGPMAAAGQASHRRTVSVSTVSVTAPGNAPIAIVPFTDAAYTSCSEVPAGTKPPASRLGPSTTTTRSASSR